MGPPAHATTSRHGYGGALEKLKSVVMKCAMASAPSKSLSLQQTAFIDKRIQELLPTPHHPPYAWMIENAMKELNLEGRSWDEEAISKFISQQYKDLPWPHSAFLHHHLNNLSKNHLTITTSSSSTPSYASTDHSSASTQCFERTRTRKKKMKTTKSGKQKKRMNARGGMSNWGGEMMIQGQEGSDICLDGMGEEVDIQSLLTEDETDIQVPNQQQQQIIVFGTEAHGINDQHSEDDSSTPTTFPSKARRIRNSRRSKHRKMRESESNMINVVEANTNTNTNTMEGETQVHVNGVEQDSMDELIEQVYGELTGTLCLTIDGEEAAERNVQINQTYEGINEQEQQQGSCKMVEKQKHIKEDQSGSGVCIEEQSRPKLRPRPYRNVADIYKSSPAQGPYHAESPHPRVIASLKKQW